MFMKNIFGISKAILELSPIIINSFFHIRLVDIINSSCSLIRKFTTLFPGCLSFKSILKKVKAVPDPTNLYTLN